MVCVCVCVCDSIDDTNTHYPTRLWNIYLFLSEDESALGYAARSGAHTNRAQTEKFNRFACRMSQLQSAYAIKLDHILYSSTDVAYGQQRITSF